MNLIQTIKQAALDAVRESGPATVMFGVVTKTEPLIINVEQRMNIPAEMIILTSNVIDQTTQVKLEGGIKNNAVFFNGLKQGDKVLLLRIQGGQKYIVLDRLVSAA